MKYFIFYSVSLALSLYLMDLNSGEFASDTLAPIFAAIFGLSMFSWIAYKSITDTSGPNVATTPDVDITTDGGGGDL